MTQVPAELAPSGVKRLVYKELQAGDYRKLTAQSNDATSGGGARDLRFPYNEFDGIFAKLLPGYREEQRRRRGALTHVTVRTGKVHLNAAGKGTATTEMVWESPTDARGSEGRLVRVHESDALAQLPHEPHPNDRVFVLFVQDDNNELRVHAAYESDLRKGAWAAAVATPMLKHLDGDRRQDRAVQGYIDFIDDFVYCHGLR